MDLKNFYIPLDNITKEIKTVLPLYNGRLPESFNKLPIIKLKKEFLRPIKVIPSFKKLANGDYHNEKTKSDPQIASHIKFFINNFDPFRKYKDVDDLTYIINDYRLLILEILKYYSTNPNISLKTIGIRINAILRIFYIAYQSKDYDIYNLISTLFIDLDTKHLNIEKNNVLSDKEKESYLDFKKILEKQQELLNKPKTYKNNQDLILLSLYTIGPILRNEPKSLEFTDKQETKGNFIYFKDNDIIMDLLDEKKKHKGIKFNLSNDYKELAGILKESYDLYPRKYLFTEAYKINGDKATIGSITKRLLRIFKDTGIKVGVSSIRSAYYTKLNDEKKLSLNDKDKIAMEMRTSQKQLDLFYNKIINDNDKPTPYKKQLEFNKKYYDKNKVELRKKHKEHYDKQDKTYLARRKILLYLNKDPEYFNKMKKGTYEKYNIQRDENGKYI
jgi:hypothetical protein